jgi:hypothetical protein
VSAISAVFPWVGIALKKKHFYLIYLIKFAALLRTAVDNKAYLQLTLLHPLGGVSSLLLGGRPLHNTRSTY